MKKKRVIRFMLNGEEKEYAGDPGRSLMDYLKSEGEVPITAAGCSGGGRCGACTVELDMKAVLSCRVAMEKVAGRSVFTADAPGQLIQDIFSMSLRRHGTAECHYCVPETVMKARQFLRNNPDPTGEESLGVVEKHLCRCIGHGKIAKSILEAAMLLKDHDVGKNNQQ